MNPLTAYSGSCQSLASSGIGACLSNSSPRALVSQSVGLLGDEERNWKQSMPSAAHDRIGPLEGRQVGLLSDTNRTPLR
jgi:hypothetical protein